jgi:hypothetical protein
MCFALPRGDTWWRYLASQLSCAAETVVVSENGPADVALMPAFYLHLQATDTEQLALRAFGEVGCADIIARCRLLRTLDPALARRMIGAMWATWTNILDEHLPDLFLSFPIDRYVSDVAARILAERAIPYIGLSYGMLPGHFMFMARGEYRPVHEPTEHQIDEAISIITASQFLPSYVPSRARYSRSRFAQLYAYFLARWAVFEVLRWWRRTSCAGGGGCRSTTVT